MAIKSSCLALPALRLLETAYRQHVCSVFDLPPPRPLFPFSSPLLVRSKRRYFYCDHSQGQTFLFLIFVILEASWWSHWTQISARQVWKETRSVKAQQSCWAEGTQPPRKAQRPELSPLSHCVFQQPLQSVPENTPSKRQQVSGYSLL